MIDNFIDWTSQQITRGQKTMPVGRRSFHALIFHFQHKTNDHCLKSTGIKLFRPFPGLTATKALDTETLLIEYSSMSYYVTFLTLTFSATKEAPYGPCTDSDQVITEIFQP